MWQAHARKTPLPCVIKINSRDREEVKMMKRIILNMTKYIPEDRLSLDDVEQCLTDLIGMCIHVSC